MKLYISILVCLFVTSLSEKLKTRKLFGPEDAAKLEEIHKFMADLDLKTSKMESLDPSKSAWSLEHIKAQYKTLKENVDTEWDELSTVLIGEIAYYKGMMKTLVALQGQIQVKVKLFEAKYAELGAKLEGLEST